MGKMQRKEMPMWAQLGHKKPTTRREFLGYGVIPFAARALVPGALGLLTGSFANAAGEANCPTAAASIPFITMNLSGGAGLSSNFMPLDRNMQPLASYDKMGNGSGANIPARVNEMGNANFSAQSQFLIGLQAMASQAARDKTAFIAGCVQSRDDSAENQFDASGMAFKAGVLGSILPNLGTRGTPTGVNQKPSTVSPPSPLVVNSMQSISNSIGYTAALKNSMSKAQMEKVAKLTNNLSASQSRRLASISTAAQVQTLVSCAGVKNVDLIAGGGGVDPLLDTTGGIGAAIGTLYGINNNSTGENRVFSAMAYNAMKGTAGTVNLEIGGYDYHNGTRTAGDAKDLQAGQQVGRIIQMAHLMSKPVFIYVTSDGAVGSTVSANPGSSWSGDRGNAGMMFMIMYNPAGRPATTAPQIGFYNAGQAADESSPIGAAPAMAAQAAFANYTKFAYGAQWETYFRRSITRGAGLDADVLMSVIKVA